MLQALADRTQLNGQPRPGQPNQLLWLRLAEADLQTLFPFWSVKEIQRIEDSLQQQGLLLAEADSQMPGYTWYALEEPKRLSATPTTNQGKAAPIPINWQPGADWIRLCLQQGIPEAFVHSLVSEFVNYWREVGEARPAWGNIFYSHALRQWRMEQTRQGEIEQSDSMSKDWHPSTDAMEILINAGINRNFIEDAIPEFILYWRERGTANVAWNTKFIGHIRRQWAKFSAAFGYDDTPQLIPDNWEPSSDCFEILQLAEIDEKYARSKIPEFRMYWHDCKQARASWNTVFLQFVKRDWAEFLKRGGNLDDYHANNQSSAGARQQRVKEKLEQFADRSWAA